MVFFVIYTAYENIYRKTSKILVLFISAVIFAQYAFSNYWYLFEGNNELMD
jgi:hypothetical protein